MKIFNLYTGEGKVTKMNQYSYSSTHPHTDMFNIHFDAERCKNFYISMSRKEARKLMKLIQKRIK